MHTVFIMFKMQKVEVYALRWLWRRQTLNPTPLKAKGWNKENEQDFYGTRGSKNKKAKNVN